MSLWECMSLRSLLKCFDVYGLVISHGSALFENFTHFNLVRKSDTFTVFSNVVDRSREQFILVLRCMFFLFQLRVSLWSFNFDMDICLEGELRDCS